MLGGEKYHWLNATTTVNSRAKLIHSPQLLSQIQLTMQTTAIVAIKNIFFLLYTKRRTEEILRAKYIKVTCIESIRIIATAT